MNQVIYNRSTTKQMLYNSRFWLAFVYILILSTLYLVNIGIMWIRLVASYLILVVCLFLPTNRILIIIGAVLPLNNIFIISKTYTLLPLILVIYISKSFFKSKIIIKKYHYYSLILWFVLLLFNVIVSSIRHSSILTIAPFFLSLLFFWCAITNDLKKNQDVYFVILVCYILSTFITSVGSEIFPNVAGLVTHIRLYSLRSIGFSDEWNYGRSILVTISFLTIMIFSMRKNYLLYGALIIYFSYRLVQTALYSGLISLLFLAMSFVFIHKGSLLRRLVYGIFSMLLVLGMLIIIYELIYKNMLLYRGDIFGDNGRFVLWGKYLNVLNENIDILLFGVGGGAIGAYAASINQPTTHNMLLEMIMELGLVGSTILIVFLRYTLKDCEYRIRENINVLSIWVYLGTALTQGVSGDDTLFFLLVIGMKARMEKYENSNCVLTESL